jgi:hypothetical protein
MTTTPGAPPVAPTSAIRPSWVIEYRLALITSRVSVSLSAESAADGFEAGLLNR